MAAAWAYATDNSEPIPTPLLTLGYIDRFGAQAVLGRPLGYGEIRRMLITENIVKYAAEKQAAKNQVDWVDANPSKDRLLMEALQAWRQQAK